jgi:cytochrome c
MSEPARAGIIAATRGGHFPEGSKMRSTFTAVVAILGMVMAGAANASEALAKSSGCLNCHAVDTKKVGPAFKEVAAKYKGKADAEATLVAKISEGKGHPAVKTSAADTTTLVKWVLAQ